MTTTGTTATSVAMTVPRLAGRDDECARLDRWFVERLAVGGRGLLVTGEEGIGKSSLWRWTVERCSQAGARVLQTRAYAEEVGYDLIGVADLMADWPDLVEEIRGVPDPATRGRLVQSAIRELARDVAVVVAVDDAQWLDPSSALALRYALPRLHGARVSLIATMQTAGSDPSAGSLILPADRLDRLHVGPLDVAATGQALRERVGPITQPELLRLHDLSRGNPLAALEFTSHLRGRGLAWDEAISFPTLTSSPAWSLDGLDATTLDLIRTSALLGSCHADRLLRVAGAGSESALSGAAARRWLTIGDDLTVRVSHPLLEAAVVTSMSPLERRSLHARIAGIETDPDQRARHVAESAAKPCAERAGELERAAQRAEGRGEPAAAANLAMHAARLTPGPDDESRLRRHLHEITLRAASGEPSRAVEIADELIERLPPGRTRAAIIAQRCFLEVHHAEPMLERELDDSCDDPAVRGMAHDMLGVIRGLYRVDLAAGLRHSLSAVETARAMGDDVLLTQAAVIAATLRQLSGSTDGGLLCEAEESAARGGLPVLGRWPVVFRGRLALWAGHLDQSDACFVEALRLSATEGTCFQRPYRFHDLATSALARGDLTRVLELVDEGIVMAEDARNHSAAAWLRQPGGMARAYLADPLAACRDADVLQAWGRDRDEPMRVVFAHDIRGMAALGSGDGSMAAQEFAAGTDLTVSLGLRHPGCTPIVLHDAEAAALVGDGDRCRYVGDLLRQGSGVPERPWVAAAAHYVEGLSRLIDGQTDTAVRVLRRASERLGALGYRLDGARATLALGRALVRAGQRSAAAAALTVAREIMDTAGAVPWTRQVDTELARIRPELSRPGLTATESKIAHLVAEGKRNRDIAAELFVCESTVEAHLTRIYRKLAIGSRAALTRIVTTDALGTGTA